MGLFTSRHGSKLSRNLGGFYRKNETKFWGCQNETLGRAKLMLGVPAVSSPGPLLIRTPGFAVTALFTRFASLPVYAVSVTWPLRRGYSKTFGARRRRQDGG